MGARRKARICALQMLFQHDIAQQAVPEVLTAYWAELGGEYTEDVREFEAETVAYIACRRLDPGAQMSPYLHQHLSSRGEVPDGISLDRIMTAAGRVVEIGGSPARPAKTWRRPAALQ